LAIAPEFASLRRVDATLTIGVPLDSVGRGGGTEEAPAVLRELGPPRRSAPTTRATSRCASAAKSATRPPASSRVLDERVFPATDYLQPDGLDWDELAALLAPLTAAEALVGASLTCYNTDNLACGSSPRSPARRLGSSGC
jgi:arginase family enzyme